MVSMSGGEGLERNLKGGCGEAFCGGCLDITWHLLQSCFAAFLKRAAFTAYFEAAFFAAFFRGSCFVAFFGGGCFAAFFDGGCFAAFFRGGCFATFLEGGTGATAPLAPYKNHHWIGEEGGFKNEVHNFKS